MLSACSPPHPVLRSDSCFQSRCLPPLCCTNSPEQGTECTCDDGLLSRIDGGDHVVAVARPGQILNYEQFLMLHVILKGCALRDVWDPSDRHKVTDKVGRDLSVDCIEDHSWHKFETHGRQRRPNRWCSRSAVDKTGRMQDTLAMADEKAADEGRRPRSPEVWARLHLASWKMMPTVWRWPERTRLMPWRRLTR
jgi:hypothetical protein